MIVSSPACSAASSANSPEERVATARSTTPALSESSAAAASSASRVGAGSRATRSWNTRSSRRVIGSASGSGSSPASWAALSAVGSSTSASALPWVCSSSRSRTCGAAEAAACASSSAAAVGVEPLDRVRRHVGRLEHAHVALARGEQEHDALGVEPPCDELQRIRGPGVEPMRVVDEAQHRPLLGELGQQRQAAGVDEEALLPAAVREPERGPQRGGLGRGQAVDQAKRGAQQLLERRERQLGLRLHPARAQHVHVARTRARVVKQDRLPDPRLTPQRERAAPRVAGRVEQCANEGALSVPPKQHLPTLPMGVATI